LTQALRVHTLQMAIFAQAFARRLSRPLLAHDDVALPSTSASQRDA
jgi:hypothetical protein